MNQTIEDIKKNISDDCYIQIIIIVFIADIFQLYLAGRFQ